MVFTVFALSLLGLMGEWELWVLELERRPNEWTVLYSASTKICFGAMVIRVIALSCPKWLCVPSAHVPKTGTDRTIASSSSSSSYSGSKRLNKSDVLLGRRREQNRLRKSMGHRYTRSDGLAEKLGNRLEILYLFPAQPPALAVSSVHG